MFAIKKTERIPVNGIDHFLYDTYLTTDGGFYSLNAISETANDLHIKWFDFRLDAHNYLDDVIFPGYAELIERNVPINDWFEIVDFLYIKVREEKEK